MALALAILAMFLHAFPLFFFFFPSYHIKTCCSSALTARRYKTGHHDIVKPLGYTEIFQRIILACLVTHKVELSLFLLEEKYI